MSQLKRRGIKTPDVNIETDLLVKIDDKRQIIEAVRIDAYPWLAGEQLEIEQLDISISHLLGTPLTNVKSLDELRTSL